MLKLVHLLRYKYNRGTAVEAAVISLNYAFKEMPVHLTIK